MYESPKLVPMNAINAAYGHGAANMGLCVVNINAAANVNVGVLVSVLAPAFAVACAAAMTCANAVAVALVVNHYSPLGALDPRLTPQSDEPCPVTEAAALQT
jgi:hypothetical protein